MLSLQSLIINTLHRSYIPVFLVLVKEAEDLLAPNYHTVRVMEQVRRDNCNLYIILLANGRQAVRLLRFGDKYRLIDTRARFILRHDDHLFDPSLSYLWNKIVNIVFIRRVSDSSEYELSTVPFPAQINGTIKLHVINIWQNGYFRKARMTHFPEKTRDLQNYEISVVTFPHIPAAVKRSVLDKYEGEQFYYTGLEIEIMKSMSQAMKFQPILYEVGRNEEWGMRQVNGSYSGLFGELMSGRAQIALGNLQHTLYSLKLVDLSRPYMTQCLTFLTPASRTDNKWKTLVLPFLLNVWLAIMLTLFLGGFIFYILARYHRHLEKSFYKSTKNRSWLNKISFGRFPYKKNRIKKIDEEKGLPLRTLVNNYIPEKTQGLHIFEELQNSVLYTYGMLVSVSLPKVPTGWALRMMTGWWWFYCLLMVVSYRASLTAILAKPEPIVTIDSINELVNSPVRCGGWGEPEKLFFTTSFDPDIHKIGLKFETLTDVEQAINRVASGSFTYYQNIYLLQHAAMKHLSRSNETDQTQSGEETSKHNLHIMSDCVISMPISIGLEKNSPLKPRIDEFIQRVVEAGLIHKWLGDVMDEVRRRNFISSTEQVKALMDMRKFSGALVALGVGYIICILTLIAENLYWHLVVSKHPLFDKYSMAQFYFCNK
ncbi:ionotropic receptor 21a-like [Macrosteles quadrilineatus]|uniref:ionotropic receptor 21a-like n=1 Tax=Macrosteles quadrilineatus TaxID=74068 RepID=UPI0023E1507C|nr:ionotropic receptor 21a-like [Macrosteles quadrilineatus]